MVCVDHRNRMFEDQLLLNLTRYSHPTFLIYLLTLNAIFKTLPVDPSKLHTESASLVCFFTIGYRGCDIFSKVKTGLRVKCYPSGVH